MTTTAAAAPSIIPLRSYQRDAVDAVHAAYVRGLRRLLVHMPTGGGKTICFAHLIRELPDMAAVVLVHRDELVRQSVDKLRLVNPATTIGVVQAARNELGARITVASVQTLMQPRRINALDRVLPDHRLVIADEAHHSLAAGWRTVIDTLRPDLLVGVTATPQRGDKRGLGSVYEEIVYSVSMLRLMAEGRLAQLRGLRIDTEADLDDVHTTAGEFNEGELADTVDTPARNRLIVESWQRHASDRLRSVAFCVNVAHAHHVAEAFRAAGIQAGAIDGTMPSEERQRILAAFHAGRLPVLANCMVLTEGWDEPATDCILMARPTKSQGLYVQMVGRGARTAEGKADCLVLDYVDSTSRHQLITLPTLADEEGASTDAGGGRPAKDERADGEQIDFLEFATAHQKVRERAAVAVDLFGRSPYVWFAAGDMHAAAAGQGAWLVLRPADAGRQAWRPYLMKRVQGQPPVARLLFDRPLPLDFAMSVAEDTAGPLAERARYVRRDAAWRGRVEPPTGPQLELAQKLRIQVTDTETKSSLSARIDERMLLNTLRKVHFGDAAI